MSCERWREKLIDRLADELSEEDTIQLEQHLAKCSDCTEEERRLRHLLLSTVPREEWLADTAMEDRLVAELHRQREAPVREQAEREHKNDAYATRRTRPARTAAAPWAEEGLSSVARWIQRALPRFLRRPLPAYAALSVVLVALLAGFWLGHSNTHGTPGDRADGPVWTVPPDLSPTEHVPEAWQPESVPADQTAFAALELDGWRIGMDPDSL